MNWQKDNINLNEAFNRYCIDNDGSCYKNDIVFIGMNGTSVNIDDLIDIRFSMDELGKRVAEMGESLRRVQMALEAHVKREEPSFAPLYQFAQKCEEKKSR